jgi:E3 ubiquitin-protein ligase HOS1
MQHVEVMAWCVRHQFLEIIPSRYVSNTQWRSAVQERKAAAQERVWPEASHNSQLDVSQPASLFIEEALANLGLSEDDEDEGGRTNDLQELSWLRQASGVYTPASLRYRRDAGPVQSSSLYPPDSVRAAVDLLFLEGTSDLILAKKSIVSSSLHVFVSVLL